MLEHLRQMRLWLHLFSYPFEDLIENLHFGVEMVVV